MATTATITLSSDIMSTYTGYSKTMTMTKAGSTVDLDETIGFSRRRLAATTAVDIISMADAVLLKETAATGAPKVYVKNIGDGKGTISKDKYVTISIGDTGGTPQPIGRLYGGDWLLMPVTGADNKDVVATPETNDVVVLEYVMFFEV
tara:strand:- start:575 stop:1018 length:444 start_codon:yes stop_codon:yes gene_type:complete